MIKRFLYTFVVYCAIITSTVGQDWNIGIRAGINQSTFNGDLGANERHKLSGGFQFGVNFQWNFNDFLGLRSEINYIQNGARYQYESDNGYYLFRRLNNNRYVLRDSTDINLIHSNAYLQLPQTLHLRINKKWEVFAGGYVGMLLNPTATGTLIFGGKRSEKDHAFRQGLNFNYRSDLPGQLNSGFFGSVPAPPIAIIVDGVDIDVPGVITAYFHHETKEANRYYKLDYGAIGGVSYFLNRGLYLMGRVEYGLRDITNAAGDASYRDVNPDGSLIFEDRKTRNLSFSLSLGFKF